MSQLIHVPLIYSSGTISNRTLNFQFDTNLNEERVQELVCDDTDISGNDLQLQRFNHFPNLQYRVAST